MGRLKEIKESLEWGKEVEGEEYAHQVLSLEDVNWLISEVEKSLDSLREIDMHMRCTSDPMPYIIETLKKNLPEYDFEDDSKNRSLDDWLR